MLLHNLNTESLLVGRFLRLNIKKVKNLRSVVVMDFKHNTMTL